MTTLDTLLLKVQRKRRLKAKEVSFKEWKELARERAMEKRRIKWQVFKHVKSLYLSSKSLRRKQSSTLKLRRLSCCFIAWRNSYHKRRVFFDQVSQRDFELKQRTFLHMRIVLAKERAVDEIERRETIVKRKDQAASHQAHSYTARIALLES